MSKAGKKDLYKSHKDRYVTPKNPQLVEINGAKNLAINDHSEPSDEEFIARIGIFYMICSPVLIY